ncbi:MAG: tRNA 5-methoxyuridine(34)/uridine 5-oxyacetic acid(34) synthase CmoB [gamma proteobacterium symbiont of Phacoides pectinatus]
MIDCTDLCRRLAPGPLDAWARTLPEQLAARTAQRAHGDFPRWLEAIDRLPAAPDGTVELNRGRVGIHAESPLQGEPRRLAIELLQRLHPWRKGPYDLHGIHIDTEWRSDWKWRRLAPHITPLNGRDVLDVGCGNGYHCWRMAGAGARLVLGIDPTQLYIAQFMAVRHFLGPQWPVHLLPIGIEELPPDPEAFDTVFSMGVLYHRRSPIDHILELKGCLRRGGELVLETLVIEGREGETLLPRGRYAKMRNVWFVPTPATLAAWMKRCGLRDVRVVDVSATTCQEQRRTDWMRFESLTDYLDPNDPARTVEGYPAPLRATLIATRA